MTERHELERAIAALEAQRAALSDAMLALFGAPIAHENDPERAVLAGLAIQEMIEPLQRQLRQEKGTRCWKESVPGRACSRLPSISQQYA